MLKKNISPILWTVTCIIYKPDWARPYKNIKMLISVELGMLATSYVVIKNNWIVPTSCKCLTIDYLTNLHFADQNGQFTDQLVFFEWYKLLPSKFPQWYKLINGIKKKKKDQFQLYRPGILNFTDQLVKSNL